MESVTNESDFNVDNGLYAVKFWSAWCQPCKAFAPKVDTLDEEFEDIDFISIDIDQVPSLAQKYKVRSLPTLLIIDNGHEYKRIEGLQLIGPMRKILRDLSQSHTSEENIEKVQPVEKISSGLRLMGLFLLQYAFGDMNDRSVFLTGWTGWR